MDLQHRFAPITNADTLEGVVEGYASVFGVLDSHNTIVEKGAFERSLGDWMKRGEAPGLYMQHDYSMPLGVWEAMSEDDKGLKVSGRLAKSGIGDHTAELWKMKAIRGLSIGFIPRKWREDGKVIRFDDVDLIEVSMVTRPSNAKAKASLRSEDVRASILTVRDFEEALQVHLGYSARAAKAIAASGFKSVDDRDDPAPESASQLRDEGGQISPETLRSINDWANSILKGS
jgi:HK97 family phage prohead protease